MVLRQVDWINIKEGQLDITTSLLLARELRGCFTPDFLPKNLVVLDEMSEFGEANRLIVITENEEQIEEALDLFLAGKVSRIDIWFDVYSSSAFFRYLEQATVEFAPVVLCLGRGQFVLIVSRDEVIQAAIPFDSQYLDYLARSTVPVEKSIIDEVSPGSSEPVETMTTEDTAEEIGPIRDMLKKAQSELEQVRHELWVSEKKYDALSNSKLGQLTLAYWSFTRRHTKTDN